MKRRKQEWKERKGSRYIQKDTLKVEPKPVIVRRVVRRQLEDAHEDGTARVELSMDRNLP